MRRAMVIVAVLFVGCAHGKAPQAGAGDPRGDVAAGREVFQAKCVSCHGASGKGDGEDGLYQAQKPRDLTGASFKHVSDQALFDEIRHGKGEMLPFDRRLSDAETWNVVAYLRTLEQ